MKMKYLYTLIVAIFLLAELNPATAQITEKPEYGKFAITGATIHTVTNGVVEDGIILIDHDKISFVGQNARITNEYTQIDATGKHVYPGFIDSWTSLGLVEISAVPVTVDDAELGDFNPHMEAYTTFNPHSAAIAVTRVSGVTNVIAKPRTGIIAGKAAFMDLWGYSSDSMAVKKSAALVLELPSSQSRGRWDQRSEKEIKEAYEKGINRINDFLQKAHFYENMMAAFEVNSGGKKQPDHNPALEAMREVVRGEVPVIIPVNSEKDIRDALTWIKNHDDLNF